MACSPRLLLARFGLAPSAGGRALPEPPGSPERCVERFAVADTGGRAWLLERLGPGQAARREEIARLLDALCALDPELARMVPTHRPVPGTGAFVLRAAEGPNAGDWQLSPLVASPPLPRPGYLDDSWRGEAVAEFLLRLRSAGARLPALPAAPSPSLVAYRDGLIAAIQAGRPGLLPRLARPRAALEELAGWEAAQATVLAHGDLHPQNILWGAGAPDTIRAVIDWEFAGARPALYDAANCLGCAGFEDPSGLSRGFVTGLVKSLGLTPDMLRLLPRMVLASRLGWLSEWLRTADAELLEMELDYLDILVDGRDSLAALWSRA